MIFDVCYAKCWPCCMGQCPGGPHGWADADDIEHAAKTGQLDPSGQSCGCPCVHDAPRGPEEPDLDDPDVESYTQEPCPVCDAPGVCAWDADGRPLIHPITDEGRRYVEEMGAASDEDAES
jgi:hypothetical protein